MNLLTDLSLKKVGSSSRLNAVFPKTLRIMGVTIMIALLSASIISFVYGQKLTNIVEWEIPRAEHIACDSLGNFYVSTSSKSNPSGAFTWWYFVEKYDSNGNFLTKWGGSMFKKIQGIAVDGSGNVYVCDDSFEDNVQKFDSEGTLIDSWEINGPRGIAVDSAGSVYVARGVDIQKFDGNGNLISKWEDTHADSIAVDTSGYLYAVSDNNNILKYDLNGNFVTQWDIIYAEDNPFADFAVHRDIAVDNDGNVLLVDYNDGTRHGCIHEFDSNGNLRARITEWIDFGGIDAPSFWNFQQPIGINVDRSGNIYVTDNGVHSSERVVLKLRIESGDSSIPEFPSWIAFFLSLVAVIVVTFVYRRKLRD